MKPTLIAVATTLESTIALAIGALVLVSAMAAVYGLRVICRQLLDSVRHKSPVPMAFSYWFSTIIDIGVLGFLLYWIGSSVLAGLR